MNMNSAPKRFYKKAAINDIDSGWQVELDGRVVKTPQKAALALPTEPLARAVANEWDEQGDTLNLASMTLTRLANVAIDRTPSTRNDLVDEITRYAETDLTCFLADGPQALRERQERAWRPWRDWAGKKHSVVLVPVEGLIASPQPESSLQAVRTFAEALDDFQLTGLAWAASLFGSAVLSIAVSDGALNSEEALQHSLIDELWQIEQWGDDEEAATARAGRVRDANALGRWFDGLRVA